MKIDQLEEIDRQHLRDIVLAFFGKGDVSRHTIEYLFSVWGIHDRVPATDISEHGGPRGDGNVAAFMARLRENFADFFDWHPQGRREKFRLGLTTGDPGNYALVTALNQPPTDMLSKLWSPHFPPYRTRVVFPERLCGCSGDAEGSRRSSAADDEEDVAGNPDDHFADLSRSQVSTSYVRTMVRLATTFRTWQVDLGFVAAQQSTRHAEGNLVVLGTPSDLPRLLPHLEATAPMKNGPDGIVANGNRDKRPSQVFRDTMDHPLTPKGTELVKYALVTRHYYRYQRTLTVLAGRDELAVEAVARVLTDENALLMLASELKCRESFPDHFQALFAVHMVKGHPYARSISVERVIDLGRTA